MSNFSEIEIIEGIVKKQTNTGSFIKSYNAHALSDVYDIISNIIFKMEQKEGNFNLGQSLWFRGQSYEKYNLIPSLLRSNSSKTNSKGTYSSLSLMEDYRFQNFSSRVNHLVHTSPESRIEWQELLQHHFGSTRLMDWSESARTALSFALEPYIDSKRDRWKNDVDKITPNLWVLNPKKLNLKIYDFLKNDQNNDLIQKAIKEFNYSTKALKAEADKIQNDLKENNNIYFQVSENGESDIAIDGLISICTLDKYRSSLSGNLKKLVESREFNPYFYLLLRFYADSLPVEADPYKNLLPPLAALQPYHSERIRAQRGTFTIFPNYFMNSNAEQMNSINMNILSIEAQKNLSDCFYCIRLCDPITIAEDLICSGERRTELYPDIQTYAELLETRTFKI